MKRLAIITTHPIQYYAPLFRLLAQRNRLQVKVFYTWGEQAKEQIFDPGFGKQRSWDIPLFDGYEFEFVKNVSTAPGSSHFKGIINPDLAERIELFKPDALLLFGWAFDSHLKILRLFKGVVPIYFRGDSTLLDEAKGFSLNKIVRRLFLKWVYRHIYKALYVGTNNKAYYKAHGLKEAQLLHAPHAIDNKRFDDSNGKYSEDAKAWKRLLNIPDGKPTILFAGKLENKKNPFFLVEAAKNFPQLHFIIAGNGVLENEIKNVAAGLPNITLLPFQNQTKMPVLYRLADVFALPSAGPGETWGLALNEAMACGRVVIASNKCGGAIDLIEEGKNGFIIEPTVEAFIAVLHKILDQKTSLEMMKAFSAKKIVSFTYESIVQVLENDMCTQQ